MLATSIKTLFHQKSLPSLRFLSPDHIILFGGENPCSICAKAGPWDVSVTMTVRTQPGKDDILLRLTASSEAPGAARLCQLLLAYHPRPRVALNGAA